MKWKYMNEMEIMEAVTQLKIMAMDMTGEITNRTNIKEVELISKRIKAIDIAIEALKRGINE